MQGLLSFLLFAVFFYLMMRFGCGAHMVHGGHGGHAGYAGHEEHGADPGATASAAKDPVCGMEVPTGQGYAKMHQGRQYRFCSRRCLDDFEATPERYVA